MTRTIRGRDGNIGAQILVSMVLPREENHSEAA